MILWLCGEKKKGWSKWSSCWRYTDDSESEAFETMEAHSAIRNNNLISNKLPAIPDNIINENIRSLNMKQKQIFSFIRKWSQDYKDFAL